jgi:hypothetical protein
MTDDGAETDLDLGTTNVSWMFLLLKQIMLLQEEFIFRLLKREEESFRENRSSGTSYHQWNKR